MLSFFNKLFGVTNSVSAPRICTEGSTSARSSEELIKDLKKQANSLKKTNYLAASNLLKEALDIAAQNSIHEPIETELRYATYLFNANLKNDAFNEISKLIQYGSSFEPSTENTSHWFSEKAKCLRIRASLLSKENTKESWLQFIFDSSLSTHYEAMSEISSKQEHLKKMGEFASKVLTKGFSENLEFTLRLSEPEDIEKFGWTGFVNLGLSHLEVEFLEVLKLYTNNAGTPNFQIIESWLEKHLKECA